MRALPPHGSVRKLSQIRAIAIKLGKGIKRARNKVRGTAKYIRRGFQSFSDKRNKAWDLYNKRTDDFYNERRQAMKWKSNQHSSVRVDWNKIDRLPWNKRLETVTQAENDAKLLKKSLSKEVWAEATRREPLIEARVNKAKRLADKAGKHKDRLWSLENDNWKRQDKAFTAGIITVGAAAAGGVTYAGYKEEQRKAKVRAAYFKKRAAEKRNKKVK